MDSSVPDLLPPHDPELLGRIAALEKENALLRQKIVLLVRKLFGAKSERLDPAQLLLLLQGLDEPGKVPEPVVAEVPRRSTVPSPPRERGPRLPEHLPVIEEVIVPEPVKAAPQDWRRIGEEVERTARLRTCALPAPAHGASECTARQRPPRTRSANCIAAGAATMCSAACWMPCPSWQHCRSRSWNAAS